MSKPGMATIALRKYDVFTAIRMASEYGFAGVEIWGRPSHIPDPVDWEHVEAVSRAVKEHGLVVSMHGSYVNVGDDSWRSKAEESLRICEILGTPIMRIWPGNKEPKDADNSFWMKMVSRLRDFCMMAADSGVILAMEMHAGTLAATIPGNERLLAEVDCPNLKLNFQLTDYEPDYFDRALPTLGEQVVNIHAQNYNKVMKDGKETRELTWIESGFADYADLLKRLAAYGFDGFIEAEFFKGEFESEEVFLESIRRDSAYLRRICGYS